MFFVSLGRVIIFALQNFWRNFWLSIATVSIITLSLLSISFLGVMTVLSNQALQSLQNKVDISVALKPDLKDEAVKTVKTNVERLSGVSQVDIVTADQALENFRARNASNPLIAESLLELGNNPLGASLVIRSKTPEGYQNILRQLQTPPFSDSIQDAHYDDYRKIINSTTDITAKLKRVGGIVSMAFLLITLLVVFNAIRINIYTHREEISIMRLVGATSWFIRAPFWVESVIYVLLATLLTAAIFFPLMVFIQPYVDSFFNGFSFNLVQYFNERSWWFFGAQFLGAIVLNILASTIAMRRYLKV